MEMMIYGGCDINAMLRCEDGTDSSHAPVVNTMAIAPCCAHWICVCVQTQPQYLSGVVDVVAVAGLFVAVGVVVVVCIGCCVVVCGVYVCLLGGCYWWLFVVVG